MTRKHDNGDQPSGGETTWMRGALLAGGAHWLPGHFGDIKLLVSNASFSYHLCCIIGLSGSSMNKYRYWSDTIWQRTGQDLLTWRRHVEAFAEPRDTTAAQ